MIEILLLSLASIFLFIISLSILVVVVLVKSKDDKSSSSSEFRGASPGIWIDTNVTFFDDPSGFSGVDLFSYGKKAVTFNGKRLYPCAVHHDHAAEYLWSVVEVQGDGLNPVYLHVLDICNRKDAPCTNKNKNGRNFLVDVHKTAWDSIGKTTGVLKGRVRKVGKIGPKELPSDVFLEGDKTYVMCSCTGDCSNELQQWKPIDKCI